MRLFKRGSTWSYTVELPSDHGRKRKTKGGFATKKQAQAEAAQLEAEISSGTFVPDSALTLRQCCQLYTDQRSAVLKATTMRGYTAWLSRLCDFFPVDIKLKDISRIRYQSFIDSLDMTPVSQQSAHRACKTFFTYAVNLDLLRANPADKIQLRRDERHIDDILEDKYFTRDELQAFLVLAQRTLYYPHFLTLAYTGMRAGELTALQWGDIDGDIIKIRRNITIGGLNYIMTTTKTRSGARDIIISPLLVAELSKHRQAQRYERLAATNWHDADFVFTSTTHPGYPVDHTTLYKCMQRLTAKLSLSKHLCLHSFRHTHASLLAQAGATLESIQERLGHSKCDITRRIYLHVTKELKRDAADRFDKLMQ